MEIIFEPQFQTDYENIVRQKPWIKDDFQAAIESIFELGFIPEGYDPHLLINPDSNYTGYMEFHLSDGKTDVLVIYVEKESHRSLRFIRMGSHDDLFHGSLL